MCAEMSVVDDSVTCEATVANDSNMEIEEFNSDMDILESNLFDKEYDMSEEETLKHISHQILDKIEFECVPDHERRALCKLIMTRGLTDLREGKVTSTSTPLALAVFRKA